MASESILIETWLNHKAIWNEVIVYITQNETSIQVITIISTKIKSNSSGMT